jgi:hypothetical protein
MSSQGKGTAAILDQYEETISELGYSLRAFLLSVLENIIELPDAPANVIGYGYGSGYKDMICTIIPSKKGIKLGLAYSAALPDPAGLLQGGGKVHKYITLKSVADFDNEAVRLLLQQALKAREERILPKTKT